jgi:hypothetical protein
MQRGHYDLRCGPFLRGVHLDRNTPAVIDYGYAVVLVDSDLDFRAEFRHCFVDRIIDDFIDKVV